MASRYTLTQCAATRAKIQTSQLINRLQEHALNKGRLESTQLKAIEILLRKTLPDLSSVELSTDPDNPPTMNLAITDNEILSRYLKQKETK